MRLRGCQRQQLWWAHTAAAMLFHVLLHLAPSLQGAVEQPSERHAASQPVCPDASPAVPQGACRLRRGVPSALCA